MNPRTRHTRRSRRYCIYTYSASNVRVCTLQHWNYNGVVLFDYVTRSGGERAVRAIANKRAVALARKNIRLSACAQAREDAAPRNNSRPDAFGIKNFNIVSSPSLELLFIIIKILSTLHVF